MTTKNSRVPTDEVKSLKDDRPADAATARTEEHGAHGGPEVPLNNITSGNSIEGGRIPDDFLPLRMGIDTLVLSYRGEMKEEARTKLEELKRQAQSRHESHLAQAKVGEHVFRVSDKGRGRYKYLLMDGLFEIQLNDTPSPAMPVAYVKVLSDFMAAKTPLDVATHLWNVLEHFCVLSEPETVSRGDLFLDFVFDNDFVRNLDQSQFITRAEVIRPYFTKHILTGWDIGLGSALAARIYDKTLQIGKSGQDYLKHLWVKGGWDTKQTVWRVEFQLRRSVLGQFNINSVRALVETRAELWTYLTQDWLRVAVINPNDQTRSRWKTHPVWLAIWDGGCGPFGQPLLKRVKYDTAPDLGEVLQRLCSAFSSLFAILNVTKWSEVKEWVGPNLVPLLREYRTKGGIPLDEWLMEQTQKKLREYNLRLQNQDMFNPRFFRS